MKYENLYDNSVLWQMSPQERMAFFHVTSRVGGGLALEVGSYVGGSLRHLSADFENVISVDINFKNLANKGSYKNVTFMEGDSREVLPTVISHLNEEREQLDFVLIDGNHEYEYVMADLENVLDYVPQKSTGILIHDSWYLPSRQAICACKKLRECPYVHFVDTDFCSGTMMNQTTCVGGFCYIEMSSMPREGELVIHQSMDNTFRSLHKLPWL